MLEPQHSSHIRAHERHLRKAGPLRALSAYARDKNVLKLVRTAVGVFNCLRQGAKLAAVLAEHPAKLWQHLSKCAWLAHSWPFLAWYK